MFKPLNALVFPIVITALFVSLGGAQPRQGHVVLGSAAGTTGVFSVDWVTGSMHTIRAGLPVESLHTSHGNGSIIASRVGAVQTDVIRLTSTGTVTTLVSLPARPRVRGWALDQNGTYVFAANDNRLYRMLRGGGSVSTFTSIGGPSGRFVSAMCRDSDRGYFMVGTANPNQVLRIDRVTGAATTFTASIPGTTITGIDFVPPTEDFVVSTFSATYLVRPIGFVAVAPGGSMVTVDERENRIFVCDPAGRVHELDNAGTIVRSRAYPGFGWSCVEIYDDQNVSLSGAATANATMAIALSFPESPNRAYCAALAGEDEPGIPFGGRYLNLQLDFVFLLTACRSVPGFTSGFAGITDANGRANASVSFAPGFPATVRLFRRRGRLQSVGARRLRREQRRDDPHAIARSIGVAYASRERRNRERACARQPRTRPAPERQRGPPADRTGGSEIIVPPILFVFFTARSTSDRSPVACPPPVA